MIDIPTQLVILGATGDLMTKKIIPSLYHLFLSGKLPVHFRITGFSRRELDDHGFRENIATIVRTHEGVCDEQCLVEFLKLFSFQRGNFDEEGDFASLLALLQSVDDGWGLCSNKLLYLAVPPTWYSSIFSHLKATGLSNGCGENGGWTRIIVEKPFGSNAKTSEELDEVLGTLFKEEQIYRIDHYLAKETFQNILAFRFSNNIFAHDWGRELIESIAIRVLENVGVEKRGAFYDSIGALRDVGQNHLLQMLSLVTMEQPALFSANAVREQRANILRTLKIFTRKEISTATFRAQYDGYRAIENVKPDSMTETYFRIHASLDHPLWRDVPITLEAGKRLRDLHNKEEVTEIEVIFRHPSPCLCPVGRHYKNSLVFRQDPKESITLRLWLKKPGHAMALEERTFDLALRPIERAAAQYTEEYEKLLLDCIAGDQTLFISTDEVRAMWRFVDPILSMWKENTVPLAFYAPDTTDILARSSAFFEKQKEEKGSLALFGLGRMGGNLARRLVRQGWRIVGWNRTYELTEQVARDGIIPVHTREEAIRLLPTPRIIWLMVPAGLLVDDLLFGSQGIVKHLTAGDIVIDGGNSYFKDAAPRAQRLAEHGIQYMDVGTSGGPGGALRGPCLMIGGERKTFDHIEPLFADLAADAGYQFFEGHGAGHFVKMVHNGIEYGMMQAIAEGFDLMKHGSFHLDLTRVADIYNHGSVIESRLVGWLQNAFRESGEDLSDVSGSVAHTGEGAWTIQTAHELGIEAKVIEDALEFRKMSEKNPSYAGKIVSALRGQFGQHAVKEANKPLEPLKLEPARDENGKASNNHA